MRNLLIAIGVVLVLLTGALMVVPRLIGTDQLTAFLTQRLRAATGYNVSIRGPVALSVLPSPSLSIDDIHVTANAALDGAELARAAGIEIDVALLPLLGGRVEVTAVTVRDPVVTLDGPPKAAKPVDPSPPSTEAASSPPGSPGSKFSVAVRHVRVTNGSVSYRDAGKTFGIDHLDLDLTTAPDGAISGSADTGLGGDKLHVTGRIGSTDCTTAIPLSLHAMGEAGAARLDFDGTATCETDRPVRADGKLKLMADSARAALAPFTHGTLPPALDRHFALDGTLGLDRTRADLADLTVDLDQTHGAGSLTARAGDQPSIEITLDLNRLDLGPWLEGRAPVPAASGPVRQAAGGPQVATPPVAAGALHVGLDLSAELLSWSGGLIRQARFNGGLDQGAITINQATAELPGGTDLSISGQVADAFAAARFTGTLDAETDNLRALIDWSGLRLSGVPADRLRQASLSTNLDLAADRASATGVELELDGSRFKGAANLVFGARPAIGLRLAGDQLNLDAYLAGGTPVLAQGAPKPLPASPADATPAEAPVPVAAAAALLPLLAANLDLSFGSVIWRGQLLKAVHLAGAIDEGVATVHDARIGDLGGGAIAFNGRWSGGLGPGAVLSGHLQATGGSAVPLLSFAGLGGQETAGRLGAYGLDLRIAGSPAALDVDTSLTAEDGRLAAKGRLGFGGAAHFIGSATLDHPEAARLLALAAPLYRPAGVTLGALAFSAAIDATPTRLALDHLSLSIGGQRVEGMATLDGAGHPARLDADLLAGDLVLDPFLPAHEVAEIARPVRYAALGDPGPLPGRWPRTKLDFSGLGLLDATVKLSAASVAVGQWHFDKPALAANLKGGALGLEALSAGLFGGKLQAHGSLTQAPALALVLSGQDLDLKDLSGHLWSNVLAAGTGALDLDLTAAGASQADLVGTLGGKARLAARDGTATGFDLAAINDRLAALKGPQDLVGVLQAAQGGGTTRFSTLDATATIANGVIRSNDLRLAADGGTLTATVTADLPAWTIDGKAALALAGRTDLPPLAMSFEGPLDRPEKRIDVKTLSGYVERQGVGALLQGLSGTQPATPASPSQQQQKPAQPLQNLFKGLLSKPNP
ncbi:MAG TPA: AsmA family protein [Aliidongia sp.]|uniref:AsmA family protein n=1 Tax=Aliidongia sp. TaxID=1914230 RepID=UPI002DDCD4E3|nr:AsmA family protein [Aliidongia sp.]HEV2673579.1 AsmA family protein [Aliidongia sp.]